MKPIYGKFQRWPIRKSILSKFNIKPLSKFGITPLEAQAEINDVNNLYDIIDAIENLFVSKK